MHQMNSLNESRTDSSKSRKERWLEKRKLADDIWTLAHTNSSFLFSHRESTLKRTHWGRFKDGSWHIKPGILTSGLNTSSYAEFGSDWPIRWKTDLRQETQTGSGLLIDAKLHSCGIRFTTGKCHANDTRSWINILENLGQGFLQR